MSEPDGFLKRHGFLIAGVALPILVVVIFVLARTLPRLWVSDPRHDVLYAVRSNYGAQAHSIHCALSVVDGRLGEASVPTLRWTAKRPPRALVNHCPTAFRSARTTPAPLRAGAG